MFLYVIKYLSNLKRTCSPSKARLSERVLNSYEIYEILIEKYVFDEMKMLHGDVHTYDEIISMLHRGKC